jgi:hypothetical protein
MSRHLIQFAALTAIVGGSVASGMTTPAVASLTASSAPRESAAVLSSPPTTEYAVTIIRSLASMNGGSVQMAQAEGSSAAGRDIPSSNPSASARGPIGSQGTSNDSLNTTGGMTGGMRAEEGMQSGQAPSERMMNQSQGMNQEERMNQSTAPQQQQQSRWWNPLTWGRGMRSQQDLQPQNRPSSGAAMRDPRFPNETVVEQPWRAPDVPGGERGQTSTGRQSRTFGGTAAQSNPSTGSDYFYGGRQQQRQQEQE